MSYSGSTACRTTQKWGGYFNLLGVTDFASQTLPAPFKEALSAIRHATRSSNVTLSEIPAPKKITPYSLALEGELPINLSIPSDAHHAYLEPEFDTSPVHGKFVLLYTPQMYETWESNFRVAVVIHSPIETDLSLDPLFTEVAWSWLGEAAGSNEIKLENLSGTVSKTTSHFFGQHAKGETATLGATVEFHASWSPREKAFGSPDFQIGKHFETWVSLMNLIGGYPLTVANLNRLREFS